MLSGRPFNLGKFVDYCKGLSLQIYGPDGAPLIPRSPMYQLGAQVFHLNDRGDVNHRPFSSWAPVIGCQIGEMSSQKAEIHENAKFFIPCLPVEAALVLFPLFHVFLASQKNNLNKAFQKNNLNKYFGNRLVLPREDLECFLEVLASIVLTCWIKDCCNPSWRMG